MFGFFNKKERPENAQALALYETVVIQARTPVFYAEYNVPDSVDGRFDMISLHQSLAILRLEELGEEGAELSQALFDQMFLDMDRSLREMGISDLSVPKHMKRMLNGFNGRAQAYKDALTEKNREKLEAAIARNVFGTAEEINEQDVTSVAEYVEEQWQHIKTLSLQDFQNAQKIFIER